MVVNFADSDESDSNNDEQDVSEELEAKRSKNEASLLPSLDKLLEDKTLAAPDFLKNQITAKDPKTFDKREPERIPTPWLKRPGEKTTEDLEKEAVCHLIMKVYS